ncbi:uncharacterized protein VTP21DRAFT_2206 [Calcarisporiella thermophila]|uniref:uncharacterized protein n=1 Tax=Calcarisporiella thermophila TaxID=911321 RepID=UPI0037446E27
MAALQYTKIEDLAKIHERVTKSFKSGKTRSFASRKKQLLNLYKLIDENQDLICDALNKDLHKPRPEALITEINPTKSEIALAHSSFEKWALPEKVSPGVALMRDTAMIRSEPKGVVLIIGPWNYPVYLLLCPLAGAIAAGNTVILKQSEVTPHTSATITVLIQRYLDPDVVQCVNGGPEETQELLKLRFDHIFFTGSGVIGRHIMKAAAEHLCPVTLELGGKSPCIVSKDADLKIAAKRIAWGKLLNAGQTCIAPDYILCEQATLGPLVDALKESFEGFFNGKESKQSPDYGRVVNERHWDRLNSWLKESRGKIVIGGQTDRSDCFIAPTVVVDVSPNDKLMQEEIFGPLLPIITVPNMDAAIDYVNQRDQPLVCYVFGDHKFINRVADETRSGGFVGNDCLIHIAISSLPFGGVGPSGTGAYHGKASFDTFSHRRSVLVRNLNKVEEALSKGRYPPYVPNSFMYRLTNALLFYRLSQPSRVRKFLVPFAVVLLAAVLAVKGQALREFLKF